MASVKKRPLYQTIQGIRFPSFFSPKCFTEALAYKPKAGDVIIDTYPKCGTTWAQCLVIHIYRKGVPLENPRQFFFASPFIDMLGNDGLQKMLRPGPIKTHLPYSHVPLSPEAKYIYVVRNPFDTCVSLFHHTRMLPGLGYWDGEFDDFFELFIAGEVEYNDYFDHLLSWYPHLKDKNVCYTTYEAMKKDTKAVVHQLAKFIGKEYADAIEKDNQVLNNILHYGKFDTMKRDFEKLYDMSLLKKDLNDPNAAEGLRHLVGSSSSLELPEELPKMEFVRKGIVGDWKNYFSPEQERRLQEKLEISTRGKDMTLLWP